MKILIMKTKSLILTTLCVVFLLFSACETPLAPPVKKDTTRLWPAADSTGKNVGFINKKGEMVIPAQYKYANFFSNGMAKVSTFDYKTQFIDTEGNVVYTLPEGESSEAYFVNGFLKFYKYIPPTWSIAPKYGLYDSNFNPVIPDKFLQLGNMSKEGLVATEAGYYNKKGELALTFNTDTFDMSTVTGTTYTYDDFCDGVAVIHVSHYVNGRIYNGVGAINTKGEWVIDTTTYRDLRSIGGGLIAYMDSTILWGLMDIHGNKVTEPVFEIIGGIEDNDLIPVCYNLGRGWGYVDKTGTIRIEPAGANYCEPFHEGVAWVNHVDYYSLIDTAGNILFDLDRGVQPLSVCHNGLMFITNYHSVNKYIDKNNNVIYSWDTKKGDGYYPVLKMKRL